MDPRQRAQRRRHQQQVPGPQRAGVQHPQRVHADQRAQRLHERQRRVHQHRRAQPERHRDADRDPLPHAQLADQPIHVRDDRERHHRHEPDDARATPQHERQQPQQRPADAVQGQQLPVGAGRDVRVERERVVGEVVAVGVDLRDVERAVQVQRLADHEVVRLVALGHLQQQAGHAERDEGHRDQANGGEDARRARCAGPVRSPQHYRRRAPAVENAAAERSGGDDGRRRRSAHLQPRRPHALPPEGAPQPGRVRAHAARVALRHRAADDRLRDRAQPRRRARRSGDAQRGGPRGDRAPGLPDRARPVQRRDQHSAAPARRARRSPGSRTRCGPCSTTPNRPPAASART